MGRRRFLIAMAWNGTMASEDVDTRAWSFTAESVEGFRVALAALLEQHSIKLSALFDKIDRDDDKIIDNEEWCDRQ